MEKEKNDLIIKDASQSNTAQTEASNPTAESSLQTEAPTPLVTAKDFNIKLHSIGRIWMAVGILLFIAVPVILCIYYKVLPDWAVFGSAAVIIPMLLNTGSGLLEPILYAPMLGTNGEYLAFITGNLSNLKIPCVVKSQEIVGTKTGTEENELVSTIAIATSSLVTVLIISIVVLCLAFSGLTEVIRKNNFIVPAFGCVVYALFGSLGGKYVVKNPKLASFPAIILVALSVVLSIFNIQMGSVSLFVGIGICALFAFIQFKREKKKILQKKTIEPLDEDEQVPTAENAQPKDEKSEDNAQN